MGRVGLPEGVAASVERELDDSVVAAERVSGGSINQAFRVELAAAGAAFLKTRSGARKEEYLSEAASLSWLAEPGAVRVPRVLGAGEEPAWLAIEWVEPGPIDPRGEAELGRGLAALHRSGAPAFGALPPGAPGEEWEIASLRMPFEPATHWPAFHAERQLTPLTRMARDREALTQAEARAVERLCDRLPELAGPPEPPARLHGDLWSGNVLGDARGAGWLIDPAAYGGHREVDLAMLRLFGSPSEELVSAYEEAWPPADGHRERVELWQVLPLLIHAALFGGGYGRAAAGAAAGFL